jgi:hypothetical protein
MKKYLSLLLAVTVLAGISGCGDNKTKQKLYGTSLINATSGNSYVNNPTAASMTALYKVTFAGAGAGDFSTGGMSVIRRSEGMSVIQGAPSADEGVGLGTPNGNGAYVMADPVLGMTVTVAFSKGGTGVYMDFTKLFGSDGLYLYSDDLLTATKSVMNQDFNPLALTTFPQYIPSIWLRADTHQPERWYPINSLATFSDDFDGLSAWMMGTSFPDLMTTTVTGAVPGGTMNLSMTTTMVARATNETPVNMTGNGTITFDTGEVWTITSNLNIGENGPINGTQTFTSTNGNTGTLTFLNGSMDGSVSAAGVTIATIHINADGTGTYTDMATSTTYNITDAQFE